jgi:hypothetical protein
MSTVPATPTPSKTNRIPCLVIVGLFGCLILCLGIVGIASAAYFFLGPNPFSLVARTQPTATSIPLPIPTAAATLPSQTPSEVTRVPANAPTLAPTTPSANIWGTYQGVHAPFSVAYPTEWTVDNENESDGTVVFVSPDQTAAGSVIFLQAGPLSVDQAMDRINNQILSKNGDVNVFSSNKNADGSITEELEYISVALGGRVHSFARLLRVSDRYYLAIFDAPVDDYVRFTETGKKFVASLTVNQ